MKSIHSPTGFITRKGIITALLYLLSLKSFGQAQRTFFPIWTFHQKNARIYGLSAGLWNFSYHPRNTTTSGIRLSLIGEGIAVPFVPGSPIAENDSVFRSYKNDTISERINGVSISGTGNAGYYAVNGIALGYIGHLHVKVNGLSTALFMNYAQIHHGIQGAIFFTGCYQMNGVQVALVANEAVRMNGIQIGLFNDSKRTRGIQIGLWNTNEKRKLPLLNWNFRT